MTPKAGAAPTSTANVKRTAPGPDWTGELLELVNILAPLADREPEQAGLLDRILTGPLMSTSDLEQASVLPVPSTRRKPPKILRVSQGTILE